VDGFDSSSPSHTDTLMSSVYFVKLRRSMSGMMAEGWATHPPQTTEDGYYIFLEFFPKAATLGPGATLGTDKVPPLLHTVRRLPAPVQTKYYIALATSVIEVVIHNEGAYMAPVRHPDVQLGLKRYLEDLCKDSRRLVAALRRAKCTELAARWDGRVQSSWTDLSRLCEAVVKVEHMHNAAAAAMAAETTIEEVDQVEKVVVDDFFVKFLVKVSIKEEDEEEGVHADK
jgi:hypothetical protein